MFGKKIDTAVGREAPGVDARLARLKQELHGQLLSSIDFGALRSMDEGQLRSEFRRGAEELCRNRLDLLSAGDRKRLIDELVNEALGYGPLESLLSDDSIADILINGPNSVFVERDGRLERTAVSFYSEDHLLSVIQRIVGRVGRRIDESSPLVDARLADGSRVNAVVRPLALDGPLVSIRRFAKAPMSIERLISVGSLSRDMAHFLRACVQARLNILISGGTGGGKTTLINLLSGFISPDERIVTIEDSAELRLSQPHVARMETRPPNLEGHGEITTRELLRNALRMRPDRIIIGECRGGEAFDMLQAMNTGHDGSLTSIHANSAHDAVDRLQMLVGLAGLEVPLWYIDRQIAAGLDLVVHVARLSGGVRKLVEITEVAGLEGGQIKLNELFAFHQTGVDYSGIAQGEFRASGVVPRCLARFKTRGIALAETGALGVLSEAPTSPGVPNS